VTQFSSSAAVCSYVPSMGLVQGLGGAVEISARRRALHRGESGGRVARLLGVRRWPEESPAPSIVFRSIPLTTLRRGRDGDMRVGNVCLREVPTPQEAGKALLAMAKEWRWIGEEGSTVRGKWALEDGGRRTMLG